MDGETVELLKNTKLFESLKSEDFKRLLEEVDEVEIPQGVTFIEEGELADALYVIKDGLAQVYFLDSSNQEIVLADLQKGEFFGEQALLEQEPGKRSACVRSTKDLVLMKVEASHFQEIVNKDEKLKKNLKETGYNQLLKKLKNFLVSMGVTRK